MKRIKLLIVAVCLISGGCKEKIAVEKQIIGKYKAVFTEPPKEIPAPYSIDAPMLGNGYTGVAISGNPEKQVYYLARNDFWRLKSSYDHSFPAVLGKLNIDIPALKNSSYLVEQNLYDAKTYSTFAHPGQEVRYKTYVAATEDLMVVEISLHGEGELEGTVNLELPSEKELIYNPPFDLLFPTESENGITDEGIGYLSRAFTKDVDIPTRAACAFSIIGSPSNKIKISKKKSAIIVVAFSSNFKSEDCLETVIEKVKNVGREKLKAVEKEHESWWKDFWSKSYVDIGDDVIEKQYYLSNYGMASFSRDKDFPPSLIGTCVTKDHVWWNGDYHLNYNHFAPYYGLFSSNHIEQAIPCNIPLLAMQERGEYYSEKLYGIKGGILLPVGVGPLGIETTRRNEDMDKYRQDWINENNVEDEGLFWKQKSDAAYCVVNMAQHFYSTYDNEYVGKYYPFVKGVATFWENYLVSENGRYVIYNDAVHEGTDGTKNSILSLGLVRLVMQTAIDMSKELGVDLNRTGKWKNILDNLSDYPTQEREGKKVFRYTEVGLDWWGDNSLGIQHIYPANQIGLDSNPELLQVAYNTVDVMQRWLDVNGSNSFFPAAARVGYTPDTILVKMHDYINNTCPNGFQRNNPHGPENYSTIPNAINEMLCMGYSGILHVFPVWPKSKDAVFNNLREYGAFLVSSELKSGQVSYVDIISEKGKLCRLKNPWPGESVIVESNKSKPRMMKGDILEIETQVGEVLNIKVEL